MRPTDPQHRVFAALLAATGWSPGHLAGHLAVLGLDPAAAGTLAAAHLATFRATTPPSQPSPGLFQFSPPGTYTPRPFDGTSLGFAAHLDWRYRRRPDGQPFRPAQAAADALDTGNALGTTVAVPPVGQARYSDGTPVGDHYRAALARHRDDPNRWADDTTRRSIDDALRDRIARDRDVRLAVQHDALLASRMRPPSDLFRIAAGTDPVTGAANDRTVYKAVPPTGWAARLGPAVRAFGRDFARTLRQLWR